MRVTQPAGLAAALGRVRLMGRVATAELLERMRINLLAAVVLAGRGVMAAKAAVAVAGCLTAGLWQPIMPVPVAAVRSRKEAASTAALLTVEAIPLHPA